MNIIERIKQRIKRWLWVPPRPGTIEHIRWQASLAWEDEEEE